MSTTTLTAWKKTEAFINSIPSLGGQVAVHNIDPSANLQQTVTLSLTFEALAGFVEGILAEHALLLKAVEDVANRQIDGTAHAAIKMFMMASNLSTCTIDVNHLAMQAEGYNLTAVVLEDGRVQFTLDAAAG